MRIIIALLIFSAIILFHELGHFLLAKANHIVVVEFSLGMGPRLLSWQGPETRYSLKLLPFGGSCAMLGEDTDDQQPGSFLSAPVWGRISVVAAGPVFNFILALVFSMIIVALAGSDRPYIVTVDENSAAYEAGLREGDVITKFNGYGIDLGKDLYVYSYLNEIDAGQIIHMTVKRDGEKKEFSFYPDKNVRYLLGLNRTDSDVLEVGSLIPGMPLENTGVKAGDVITSINGFEITSAEAYDEYIAEHPLDGSTVHLTYEHDGLEYETDLTPAVYETPVLGFSYNLASEKLKATEVPKYGLLETKYMIRTTRLSLKGLFTGGIGINDLSGPVGVVDVIGDTYEESRSMGVFAVVINLMNIAVLLSANLGVMNLLPLPALDGGRLVFLLIEAIRRKPGNRELEGMIHFVGLMLLLVLMVVIMYHDVIKIL